MKGITRCTNPSCGEVLHHAGCRREEDVQSSSGVLNSVIMVCTHAEQFVSGPYDVNGWQISYVVPYPSGPSTGGPSDDLPDWEIIK